MRRRIWWIYLIGAAGIGVAYFFGPAWAKTGRVFNLFGVSSVVAIFVGVRLHHPRQRLPWYLFAAGQLLFVAGDVITYNYEALFGHEAPFPSSGDALYLAVYPVLAAGLILLVRSRSSEPDYAALIDSVVVAIGVGVVSWAFLIGPNFHATMSVSAKLTSIAYPVGDLLLLWMMTRLAVGSGIKNPAFYLLTSSIVCLLVTDSIYTYVILHGEYNGSGSYLDAGWALFYVLWGAAALHPSMRALSHPMARTTRSLSTGRLALLCAATLMVPLVRGLEHVANLPADDAVMVPASIVIFLLVGLRMSGLVRRHEQAETRERALRRVGAALVAATDRDDVYRATVDAVRAFAGPRDVVRLGVVGEGDDETVAWVAGHQAEASGALALHALPREVRDSMRADRTGQIVGVPDELVDALGLPRGTRTALLAPISMDGALTGLVVVGSASPLDRQDQTGIEGVADQASLALARATLAENLHRRKGEARFASLVSNATDVIAVMDVDSTIRYLSPSVERILGWTPVDLLGGKLFDLVHEDDRTSFASMVGDSGAELVTFEARWQHRDGSWPYMETVKTDLTNDPNVAGIVLNSRDVSERKVFEQQLSHQAFHDLVTGLPNRALFQDRVQHALARQHRGSHALAVLLLDLDDFKAVNDSFGHTTGDRLLAEIGARVQEILRSSDTVARLGGDEFAVLLEDTDAPTAGETAERILQGLTSRFTVDGQGIFVRGSIGVAIADAGELSPTAVEELLRNADLAMYIAKGKGKDRYQQFEPGMHASVLDRLELKADLMRAVEQGEFVLHYQPIYELASQEIIGVEALIRWNHPVRGVVVPNDFIPLAEETGLIVPIGRWTLDQACREAVRLNAMLPKGRRPLTVSVNLSARQLQQDDIGDDVARTLGETGLAPDLLVIEITETVMMADMERSVAKLEELKALGVQLAVDDFGTGYSSLNYIRSFPVDVLKVDKSFVDAVHEEGEVSALTAAIIDLARILRLKPVAEGIETAQQLDRLVQMGCGFGQGFLMARPLDRDALVSLLEGPNAQATAVA
jgi:diguanylate cyclase (GGDEF)-like protein/PAS domain S-box-containing protein